MRRKIIIPGLCLSVLLSTGIASCAVQQQKNIQTTPASRLPDGTAQATNITTSRTVEAANAFLATLDTSERAQVSIPFNNENKTRWSNFPAIAVARNGLRWGDLNTAQRTAAMNLLATALSDRGLQKVKAIVEGDEVLKTTESGRNGEPIFGRDIYYIALLGTPSLAEPWMIQFGGHHLAINLTIVDKSNVLTPTLTGAQPASYKLDGETVRPLGRENDKSFALVNSLNTAQRQKAILNYQVSDLVLGPGEDGKTIQPEGIKASELNAEQQQRLLDLAQEWVGILNNEAATTKMAEIEANLSETWFAWSGPTTPGSAAYFRIQGPTLVIEYSPQRSRGSNNLDLGHIHTIYRDPTNDYGERLVQQ